MVVAEAGEVTALTASAETRTVTELELVTLEEPVAVALREDTTVVVVTGL